MSLAPFIHHVFWKSSSLASERSCPCQDVFLSWHSHPFPTLPIAASQPVNIAAHKFHILTETQSASLSIINPLHQGFQDLMQSCTHARLIAHICPTFQPRKSFLVAAPTPAPSAVPVFCQDPRHSWNCHRREISCEPFFYFLYYSACEKVVPRSRQPLVSGDVRCWILTD